MQELDEVRKEIILARENDWPPAVLTVIGLLIIGCALALFHWVNTRSAASELTNRVSGFSQPNIIESVGRIRDHRHDTNLAGATVLLEEVQVQSVLGNYMFLVGSDEENSVPVMLLGEATARQREDEKQISAGQIIRVFGVLLPLENLRRISDPEFISQEDAAILQLKDYYISGIRVDVIRPADRTLPSH